MVDIQENLFKFMVGDGRSKGRKPLERFTSFDYCYNYFYSAFDNKNTIKLAQIDNIQYSCLQIGFYLASWGMFRGSSFILWKNVKYFKNLVEEISKMETIYWEIDVDNYSPENVKKLINCYNLIRNSLASEENKVTKTLITKIMLGVFGSVPALDSLFCKAMKVYSFNEKSLLKIQETNFKYADQINDAIKTYNQKYRDRINDKIFTLDFITGNETKINYTKAKLVDMIWWIEGFK